jgi:two-component system nitrogen regulation sensor histidine kinase NtrY
MIRPPTLLAAALALGLSACGAPRPDAASGPPDARPGACYARGVRPAVIETVTLQQAALDPIEIVARIPETPVLADFDQTQIGQAFTNLVKNAGEAIEGRGDGDHARRVTVSLTTSDETAVIRIADTGMGLPQDRARLFEPYVTTRDKGTGLGLPIVKKIVEEHGGTLTLTDAEPDETGHRGAEATIRLPIMEQRT